jgi:hypothetical protein
MSQVRERARLLGGFVSLLAGMFLLGERPLLGALVMLGSMAFLLRSTARLCKANDEN